MFKYPFLLLIAVVIVTGCATSNATEQESTKVSKPLSFTMKSLDGKDVDLSKYQNRRRNQGVLPGELRCDLRHVCQGEGQR